MAHVTLAEILSQPQVWQQVLRLIADDKTVRKLASHNAGETVFIGCGTSYYLALSAASYYTMVTCRKARATTASEVLLFPDTFLPNGGAECKPILISRSGTTTEVVRVAQNVSDFFSDEPLGISCRPESDLLRACDLAVALPPADEKSVVMTRSFTSMLLLIQYLASIQASDEKLQEELSQLPELGSVILEKSHSIIKNIMAEGSYTKFVYLGHGPYYGLACEAMLKIKEMSLSSSEAYHSLEFRHGPMSMVDEDMLLTFLISERARAHETLLLKEMKALGAKTVVICESADDEIRASSDYLIELNSGLSDAARLLLYMPALQLLGYYNALAKGLDPDKPKNLSQVVTL
ncbi:SIS domain-containing protein [Candidatus Neomarinimicrobiota bacterium]